MNNFNALFSTEYPGWLDASGIELFCMKRESGKDIALWSAWKLLKDCTENELAEANMRSLFKEEIVLDAEDVLTANMAICKLHEAGIEFFAWNTGSRGLHISAFFKEIADLKDEDRARIRKAFAEEYNTDKAKGSAKTLIALENRLHWKGTGKPKTLLTQTPGNQLNNKTQTPGNQLNNKIPSGIVDLLQSADKQPNSQPLSAEDDQDLKEIWLKEVWQKNPIVYGKVALLKAEAQPSDRSSKDFVIIKCLLENGAKKLPIFRFLKTLKHSKVQTAGWTYFHYTYGQAIKRLMQ